jgi:hypothetical protein
MVEKMDNVYCKLYPKDWPQGRDSVDKEAKVGLRFRVELCCSIPACRLIDSTAFDIINSIAFNIPRELELDKLSRGKSIHFSLSEISGEFDGEFGVSGPVRQKVAISVRCPVGFLLLTRFGVKEELRKVGVKA